MPRRSSSSRRNGAAGRRSLPSRSGRGISLLHAFGETYIAQVAEVSVSNEGDVRVQIDCGTMVNPDYYSLVEAYLPIGSNCNGLSVTQL